MPVEADAATPAADAALEREATKLEKRLVRQVAQAIGDFGLIEDGDKVMVACPAAKTATACSMCCACCKRNGNRFELIAVNLDQKQPGFPAHVLPEYLTKVGVPFHIETQDTYSVVKEHIPEGKTMCSLCSRLRRGILYRVADELGATKIALGHHRDDMLQTFFFEHVLRRQAQGHAAQGAERPGRPPHHPPLAYVAESDLTRWAGDPQLPHHPLHLCGSQENLQRKQIGQMLRDWQQLYPAASRTWPWRCATWCPRTSWTRASLTSRAWCPTAWRMPMATRRLMPKNFLRRPWHARRPAADAALNLTRRF